MIKGIYFKLEKIWFRLPEKIRFLLVGGFNTVFAYLFLNLMNELLMSHTTLSKNATANIALIIQYAVTINLSFITMRYYVFRAHGNWKKEYVRALMVYLIIYALNVPIISGLIALGWSLWWAQAVYLIISTILTFLLHKYYSFK